MDVGAMLQQFNLLAAFWLTIRLAFFGAIGALVIGTLIAVMRLSPVPSLQGFALTYVTVIRNTPLTLIFFFCIFGLQNALRIQLAPESSPLSLHNLMWGIVAISVYHATYVAEALRSGVNTVPQGQAEAARAIGLDFGQSLRHVILPQTFRGSVAPLGNVLIALIKNTTVAATVGIAEVGFVMKGMMEFFPNLLYIIFGMVALAFVVLTLPTGVFFTWLSTRVAVRR